MSVIGTCSICGGAVVIPDVWAGVIPPTPTCSKCGAQAATHGPIINMVPQNATETVRYATSTSELLEG